MLLGYFLNAEALGEELRAVRPDLLERVLVVDFNVQNHDKVLASGMRVLYGDIGNPETLRHLGIAQAKVVMSTISNAPTSRAISANFGWSISRGYALAPATISFGFNSRANEATWSKSIR